MKNPMKNFLLLVTLFIVLCAIGIGYFIGRDWSAVLMFFGLAWLATLVWLKILKDELN